MNGDGEPDVGTVNGQDIFPANVTTTTVTANTVATTTLTANSATINGNLEASTIVANAGIDAGGFSTFDSISFVAARKLATPLGATEYILPTAAPPNDGFNYVLGNVANATFITTPAANANFAFDLRLGVGTPSPHVISFPQNVQLSAEYVYGLINDTIAEWFKSQGLPTSISFILLIGSFPYFNQIFFTDSVASIRIVVNGTTAMSILLGYNGTTPFISTTTTQGFPTAFTNLGPANPQLVFKREGTGGGGFQNLASRIQNSDSTISVDCQSASVAVVGDMASTGSYKGTGLLLDQSVVVGAPPVGFGLLYTDPTDRINVASQAFPTQQIAYLTDIPGIPDILRAPDGNAQAQTGDGGVTVIFNNSTGTSVFSSSLSAGVTGISSPNAAATMSVDDVGDAIIQSVGDVVMTFPGLLMVNTYSIPGTLGTVDQVLTSDGIDTASWQTPKMGLFSQVANASVVNTTVETSLINTTGAAGTNTLPAGFFTTGTAIAASLGAAIIDTSGAAQNIRFRVKVGAVTVCDTGVQALPNLAAPVSWNMRINITYTGVQLVASFVFNYGNTGACIVASGAGGVTTGIANTFDVTATWGTASAGNIITNSYCVLNRAY